MAHTETAARQLIDGVARLDFQAVEAALAPFATMRALLPSGTVEVTGGKEIAARMGSWFDGVGRLEVLTGSVESIADRVAVGYRFRVTRNGVEEQIEQRLFCVTVDGRIERLDLVCTGFRPLHPAERHGAADDFDAGDLGCADGLAGEFKKRMGLIGVGDQLRVHTVDPSAREDLPSLARLMGHKVQSVEPHPDGGLTITVERGR